MDMVIYPPPLTTTTGRPAPCNGRATSKPSYDTGQQTSREHTPTHKPSPQTDHGTEFSKAKKMTSKAWNYLTGNAFEDKEQQHSEIFKEGDCVVVHSLKDQRPITATVRWTGMVKLSQESLVPKAMFAGLEMVSCMLMNLY